MPTDEVPEDQARPSRWFLTSAERGNPSTVLDLDRPGLQSWSDGNLVTPLVHGATYFRRLHEELTRLQPGDRVFFTDWRGDADQKLLPDGPTVSAALCAVVKRGVEVRGLLWRSHSDHASFSAQQNDHLGTRINEAGGEVLLDQRVRRFGSHHQKLVILQHRDDMAGDLAFIGGIDLCHGRRDDADHAGDPQQQPMDQRYGPRAPWHDATLEVRGPVVGDLLKTFSERWDDHHPLDRRTPYRMLVQRRARMPRHPQALPEAFASPPPAGPHAVQVLRTYGRKHPGFPFAPDGERSIARACSKAFGLAQSLIYIEDQYLWSEPVARVLVDALRRAPRLRVIAVVPRFPDSDGRVDGPANRIGQIRAITMLRDAAPDRVGVFDLENAAGTPIYVHAKICIVDDIWFTVGSDNANRRSWTTDSELTCAVMSAPDNGQGTLARDLRLQLWGEHLGHPSTDLAGLDPEEALTTWSAVAASLDAWHRDGRRGPRPPGQIRRHDPAPVTRIERLWAEPLYGLLFDPDGRSRQMRRADTF